MKTNMIKHTKYKFKHHLRCFIIFNVGTVFNQVLLSVQLGATTCSLGNAPTALLLLSIIIAYQYISTY